MTKCSQRISPTVMCRNSKHHIREHLSKEMSNLIETSSAKIYINLQTDNIVLYEGIFFSRRNM